MTKEEKIKEAYGEHYETVKNYIDDNGWCVLNVSQKEPINDFAHHGKTEWKPINGRVCWSPKSLKGIENNNGWSYIPSINDKEIEKGQYWVMYPNGFIEVAYYDGTMECYKFWKLNFTHYQPIEKPKPPIY